MQNSFLVFALLLVSAGTCKLYSIYKVVKFFTMYFRFSRTLSKKYLSNEVAEDNRGRFGGMVSPIIDRKCYFKSVTLIVWFQFMWAVTRRNEEDTRELVEKGNGLFNYTFRTFAGNKAKKKNLKQIKFCKSSRESHTDGLNALHTKANHYRNKNWSRLTLMIPDKYGTIQDLLS